jgi:predicted dienelactone hydrolase
MFGAVPTVRSAETRTLAGLRSLAMPLSFARLAAAAALAHVVASGARADSLPTVPPLGPGPYAVGCTSVEQDFSRTGGQSPEAWWEGQPASNGSSRYVTDLLSTAATPVLSVAMGNDTELYGPYANTSIPVALIVCYPTDAGNPYADYALPNGSTIPHMQRSGQPPLVSGARARWPVLLFSHGLGGSPISGDHIEVFKLFASHGYVVAAPFHGDPRIVDVRLEGGSDLLVALLNFPKYTAMQAVRPLALAGAINFLLGSPEWSSRVDPNAIAGFGASLGGESLMLQAGAQLTVSVGLASKQVIADTRLKAIATYVPYFGQPFFPAFGRDQAGVDAMLPIPVLAIAGTADTTAPLATVQDAIERLHQSRILVALEGVQHGFDVPSTGDILTWTLDFVAAHALDDRLERAKLQRMERVAGGGDDRRLIDYTAPAAPIGNERIVVEFQNDALAHFFYTADPDEIAMLDAGVVVPGWRRTGFDFKAWDRFDANGIASCRFFTSRNGVYSHFYSINGVECGILAADPLWRFEALAFRADPPIGDDCPANRMRVTRIYNRFAGGAPNHRFLTSGSETTHMANEGWLIEGTVFCTPP